MATTRRYEVGVGCLVVVAAGLLVFMALQIGAISGFTQVVRVSVDLPDAAGLSTGGVVSVAGVQVGRVESLGINFDHARVVIALDQSAQIREDVRVQLRARSVLGEKYIELVPISTTARVLADGDVLSASAAQMEIDEMVNRVGPLLDAVDPQALREAIAVLTETLRKDPARLDRMLSDAEVILHNTRIASESLPALVADAGDTLATVRGVADDARPLLAELEQTVTRVDALVAAVPPDQVPALLDELQAAVRDGRAVLVKLDKASGGIQTLIDKGNSFTREDWLRITQEDGVLIRLRARDAADIVAAEQQSEP